MDAVALMGGNEYLIQQIIDKLIDAGFRSVLDAFASRNGVISSTEVTETKQVFFLKYSAVFSTHIHIVKLYRRTVF